MNKAWLIIFFLVLFCLLESFSLAEETVIEVVDGDTFWVGDALAHPGQPSSSLQKRKIRLWGVDSPELDQPMGKEAKQYMESLLMGRSVYCALNDGFSYGRLVCLLDRDDGLRVQDALIEAGYAFAEPRYAGPHFYLLEKEAAFKRRGVWQLENGGVRPWDFRQGNFRHEDFYPDNFYQGEVRQQVFRQGDGAGSKQRAKTANGQ